MPAFFFGFDGIIPDELLKNEIEYLKKDKDFYLECMSGKTLAERTEFVEKRDGIILHNNVYLSIRQSQAADPKRKTHKNPLPNLPR